MKTAISAGVVLLSVSLPFSLLRSETLTKNSDESVTVLSAGGGGHGGGGGGGGGGHAGGSSAGARGGPSSGARGYMGPRGAFGRYYQPGMVNGRYPVYGGAAIRGRAALQSQHLSNSQGSTVHHVSQNQTGTTGKGRTHHNSTTRRTAASGSNRTGSSGSNGALNNNGSRSDVSALTSHNGRSRQGNWARNNPKNKGRFDASTQQKLRDWQGRKSNVAEARQRANDCHHNHHGHDWWRHHCDVIIFVDWGWWGWWDGWWYPAWGYDPYYQYYDYDGPIYGYSGLPPDEVVAGVQSELQRLGYYSYAVDGVMGPLTQHAINSYQRDHRLPITGTIDPATVGSLGLN